MQDRIQLVNSARRHKLRINQQVVVLHLLFESNVKRPRMETEIFPFNLELGLKASVHCCGDILRREVTIFWVKQDFLWVREVTGA